jgi:hypothetical protein
MDRGTRIENWAPRLTRPVNFAAPSDGVMGGFELVGTAEAAAILGVGRAAFCDRRHAHDNFPEPVQVLACGPIWLRAQIELYAAEQAVRGRRPAGARIAFQYAKRRAESS